jgi:molybdate transport system permease protein
MSRILVFILSAGLLAILGLPLLGLLLSTSIEAVWASIQNPLFLSALWLSLRTSTVSLALLMATGLPLAWWLTQSPSRWTRRVDQFLDVLVVLPPAVIGLALLRTFGRSGLLGGWLSGVGIDVSFSTTAVILAQILVAAPFVLRSAQEAFRSVSTGIISVSRTLGASPAEAFFRVALPMARPGILRGAALAWARALGEFGATLLFAGNLPGKTQTMPLAIYAALETDIQAASSLALVLAAIALVLFFWVHRSASPPWQIAR